MLRSSGVLEAGLVPGPVQQVLPLPADAPQSVPLLPGQLHVGVLTPVKSSAAVVDMVRGEEQGCDASEGSDGLLHGCGQACPQGESLQARHNIHRTCQLSSLMPILVVHSLSSGYLSLCSFHGRVSLSVTWGFTERQIEITCSTWQFLQFHPNYALFLL